MRRTVWCAALAAGILGALAGCSQKPEETTPGAPTAPTAAAPAAPTAVVIAHPQGGVKVGDKAICAVCTVKEGTVVPEEVKATLDYKGKTYAFCNEGEKAEFISDPAKYAKS